MRKLQYIIIATAAVFFSNCDTNDNGFYNSVFLESTNLVSIEVQPNYSVGDNLYVTADFSRYQPEIGQEELVDIYKTTGNAPEFTFSYVIEKQNSSSVWEVVYVNDSQLDIIEGDAQNGAYVYGHCIYDTVSASYKYNVGFPLLSSGQYRLSFGYNSSSSSKVELRSQSAPSKLVLNINSTNAEINSSGYYSFTVVN